MDEILLLDAVERYMKGQMSAKEKIFFEELRKNNPEVDQMVVEHTFFLNELDNHAAVKTYRHALHEVENKLAEEGIITKSQLKGRAKVIYLWKRYKRNIGVAACIAVIVSLVTTGLVTTYNNQTKQSDINQLKREIKDTKRQIDNLSETQKTINPKQMIPEPAKFGGTGFIIDTKGYLVTNAHVVNKMRHIYVRNNKGEYFNTTVFYTDNASDLAVLKIVDTSFKLAGSIPYSIRRNSSDLGEQIFTLGYPRNEIVYGEGYLSAKSGNDGDSTAYQLSVSANPGNSGGPVVNKNGEVIGIITSKNSTADGVVYAAKSKNIFRLLDAAKKDNDPAVIKLPSNTALKGMDRVQQVKKMEEFVFMVVGN